MDGKETNDEAFAQRRCHHEKPSLEYCTVTGFDLCRISEDARFGDHFGRFRVNR
jgi:hypothetical protein